MVWNSSFVYTALKRSHVWERSTCLREKEVCDCLTIKDRFVFQLWISDKREVVENFWLLLVAEQPKFWGNFPVRPCPGYQMTAAPFLLLLSLASKLGEKTRNTKGSRDVGSICRTGQIFVGARCFGRSFVAVQCTSVFCNYLSPATKSWRHQTRSIPKKKSVTYCLRIELYAERSGLKITYASLEVAFQVAQVIVFYWKV